MVSLRARHPQYHPLIYVTGWVIWFGVLWYLSSRALPSFIEVPLIPFKDKILHWGYFGIGGYLAAMAAHQLRVLHPLLLFALIFGSGIGTGLLDEWHQSWVPGRTGGDLGDFAADCFGYYCGMKAASYLRNSPKNGTEKRGLSMNKKSF